jgi:hypothetical protein
MTRQRTDREQTENGEIILNLGAQVLENPVQNYELEHHDAEINVTSLEQK